jgi:hypothetical protein
MTLSFRHLALALACATLPTTSARAQLFGVRKTFSDSSGWADQVQDAARKSYRYAQLSFNAYGDPDSLLIKLPDTVAIVGRPERNGIGFQSAVYEIRSGGVLKEVVVAYRGTDGKDDIIPNIIANQNGYGLQVFDSVKKAVTKREGHPVRMVVAGHSLGGAVALYVSQRRDSVDAYTMNPSPNFTKGGQKTNTRLTFVESGEILKVLQVLKFNSTQRWTKIDCTTGSPLANHSSRKLAECITQIAAIHDEGARDDLKRNGIARLFQADGKKH